MKNNQYTATPNWFKDVQQQQQVVTTQTNYYIGGASGGGGLQSINLYNKFKIESYRITVDDLLINNNAIIAADTPLVEGEERPEDFVSEIGNNVEAENWHTSYLISVVPSTNLVANLKANSNRYGIVFYDEYNQPISGHTPIKDELVTIDVPEKARYFRCCHYIEPVVESVEEPVEPTYEFYIEYTGMGNYEDSDLNTAYGGIFENFTNVNSSVPEGINTKQLSTSGLNLIFQQPLSCTVDKNDNIKIGLDKVFTDSVGNIETIQGLWKLIEDEQGNKYIITDYNIVGKGGITAYYNDDLNPGGSGGLGGGGSIANIQVIGKGNALSDVTLSEDKSLLTFTKLEVVQKDWITAELRKYVDKESAQEITGLKNFINGLSIGSKLLNVIDGVLYINCDVAVTGGVTTYALGSTDVSTIMDGIVTDETTITVQEINGIKKLVVIGGVGNIDADELWEILGGTGTQQINKTHLTNALSGYATESWVTSQNYLTSVNWSQILNKPTTLGGYGITDAYTKTDSDNRFVNVTGDTITGYLYIQKLSIVAGNEINSSDYVYLGYRDTINGVNVCFNNKPFTYGSSRHTVWHAGNDGHGSGLDADLLDGQHSSYYTINKEIDEIDFNTLTRSGIYKLRYTTTEGYTNGPGSCDWGQMLVLHGGGDTVSQIAFDYRNKYIQVRSGNPSDVGGSGSWNSWRYLAFKDDNVDSATKLQTARTIWGQSFDGTGNVSGELSQCTRIYNAASNPIYLGNSNNSSWVYTQDIASSGGYDKWAININGSAWFKKVNIGYTFGAEGAHLLDVNGNININGYLLPLVNNKGIYLRNKATLHSGIGYDTTYTECMAFGVQNVNTKFKFKVGFDWSTFSGGGSYTNMTNADLEIGAGYVSMSLGASSQALRFERFNEINCYQGVLLLNNRGSGGSLGSTSHIIMCANGGNVGIGTISPSAKLHVAGDILATGGITCYSSDQRAKTVIEQIKLSLKQIANAPTIRFKWNDWKIKDDGKTHIGGIAQYMQKLLPETVLEADGALNMDYSTTAYIFSVQTARHLQTYETRTDRKIKKLEKEVLYLKNQLKKLGHEEANIMDD